MTSTKFIERSNRLLNKAHDLGVSPWQLEFYFATGKRYKGARARGYGKPEEEVKEYSPWEELPSEDYIKGINKED